jgi:hypothetical protein
MASPAGRGSQKAAPYPSVRLGHELRHSGREVTLYDVFDGDVLQYGPQTGPDRNPGLLQVLCRTLVGRRLRAQPAHLGQRPLEGPDHISQGYLRSGPAKVVAGFTAPVADDDAGPAQFVQYHAQELGREALVLGDGLGRHWFRCGREDEERPYAVVDFRRDLHNGSVGALAAWTLF